MDRRSRSWRPPAPVHASPARPVDVALRGLSHAANKGRLWLALGAAGALVPGRTRRAAVRGVASLAVTSAVANLALKPVFRRRRPDLARTPLPRQLLRAPATTSFPSGHAASAAAFAAGAALEQPRAAAAVVPLAAAVGYSRVHVGVHHVGDVVAGAALGVGIALAGRRWWPVRPEEPARVRAHVDAPELPGGAGLLVAANPAAGGEEDPAAHVKALLPAASMVDTEAGADLTMAVGERDGELRALGVAGGDGTVAAVAALALEHALPLAVFPAGTFNHFARDVGVDSFDATVSALRAGDAVAVDVGVAGGMPFLNTASIGAYPEIVRRRDELTPALGKWLAMTLATAQVLRRQRPVRLRIDGDPVDVWTLFVGNCAYTPRGPFPAWRPRLDDGKLDVQYLRASGRLSRTRAVLATLAGVSEHSTNYRAALTSELRVESREGVVEIARDGEPGGHAAAFDFAKLPGHLVVYRPAGMPPSLP